MNKVKENLATAADKIIYKASWIFDKISWDYICSKCKEHSEYATKYCPNCGIKMEGTDGT